MDLLADVGGTNARIAFRDDTGFIGKIHHRRSGDFSTLGLLLRDVMDESGHTPAGAAIAVAGPVTGDVVQLTNLPWRFSAHDLTHELGLERLMVENDVAALAWAVPGAAADDLRSFTLDLAATRAPKLVIAPGTGLGMASLVPVDFNRWIAVPSEGGHAHAAASSVLSMAEQAAVWHGGDAPSWEDLLSGIGLPRLYHALGGDNHRAPEDITRRAAEHEPAAAATLSVFTRLLGAFAGDAALITGARGGCYIGGGLLGALGALFDPALFLAGFRAKERFTEYMAGIPVFVLKNPHAALLGLGYLLDQDRS